MKRYLEQHALFTHADPACSAFKRGSERSLYCTATQQRVVRSLFSATSLPTGFYKPKTKLESGSDGIELIQIYKTKRLLRETAFR